jgi:hypothetical protein
VTSGGQLRAVGIAAWGIVFAASLQARSVTIAILAAALAMAFAVVDGYHSALYRQTLERAREIEGLLGDYHKTLGIHAATNREIVRTRAKLEQHRFGVHREMRPINQTPRWWLPRPVRVTWIYAASIIVAASGAVFLATGSEGESGSRDSAHTSNLSSAPQASPFDDEP